jgi:hypothetical protein
MKKSFIALIFIWFVSSLLALGILTLDRGDQSKNVKIEIQYSGIFEFKVIEYGATFEWQELGIFEYQIINYDDKHREISFYVKKIDGSESPLYIYIKNPDNLVMYSEITSDPYGDVNIDVHNTCLICHS